MPGELGDPEQLYPFHYDPRYENRPRPLELFYPEVDMYIQTFAEQYLNKPLTRYELRIVKEQLAEKGFLHRHWTDQPFRKEVIKILKKMNLARKVAKRCLI